MNKNTFPFIKEVEFENKTQQKYKLQFFHLLEKKVDIS